MLVCSYVTGPMTENGTARFAWHSEWQVYTYRQIRTIRAKFRTCPDRLVVVGGGYIGLEFGTAYAKLGSKVAIVEAGPQLLPQCDVALVRPVRERLRELDVEVLLDTMAKGASEDGHRVFVETKDGIRSHIEADRVLVAVGRRPRTDTCGLPGLGLAMDGLFLRNDGRRQTSMRGV